MLCPVGQVALSKYVITKADLRAGCPMGANVSAMGGGGAGLTWMPMLSMPGSFSCRQNPL